MSILMIGQDTMFMDVDGTITAPIQTTTENNQTIANLDYINWFHFHQD